MRRHELNELQQKLYNEIKLRLTWQPGPAKHLIVCGGSGCQRLKSANLINELQTVIKAENLQNQLKVVQTGCLGWCLQGPIVLVQPDDTCYTHVKASDAKEIINSHIQKNQVVKRLLVTQPNGQVVEKLSDLQFYKHQQRLVLRNCGVIDPEKIEDYLALGGYQALEKALFAMTKAGVIKAITNAKLQEHGGVNRAVGKNWEAYAKSKNPQKVIVCRPSFSIPEPFINYTILASDPHAVIEAMTIAAYATGATKGLIEVSFKYPLASSRLAIAIKQATAQGLLGEQLFGSDFSFNLEICHDVEDFVSEMVALEQPPLISSAKIYAQLSPIILNGSKWFAELGTTPAVGTAVLTLSGKVNQAGLVEVPMGTTLSEIIYELGGGIPNGKKLKAVQIGGPAGRCVPATKLDLPINFDELVAGSLIVMDEDCCMVDVAKLYLELAIKSADQNARFCELAEILNKITTGVATMADLASLESAGADLPLAPITSTLQDFRHEYEAHINERVCLAGECSHVVAYRIVADLCKGCTLCLRNCPVNAIFGKVKEAHVIDLQTCIKCGLCVSTCKFKAIVFDELAGAARTVNYEIDDSNPAIVRDPNQCVLCRRCVDVCTRLQKVKAIHVAGRGADTTIATTLNRPLGDTECILCGQCVNVCPTGALAGKSDSNQVQKALADPQKHVVVQFAPAIRTALGEEFKLPAGTNVTGKIPTASRMLGFDKAFDTVFGADLTIMEESAELLKRLQNNDNLPLITSCCTAWVKYCENFYPSLLKHLSTCKPPQVMLGALIKSHYAKRENLNPQSLVTVSVMPCVTKKAEIKRADFEVAGNRDVDYVITTREFATMIKQAEINFAKLADEAFDSYHQDSGAGVIFGATGGVMEAALRTTASVLAKNPTDEVEFTALRGLQGIKTVAVKAGATTIQGLVVSGIGNCQAILDEIKAGKSKYHFIEIMACPGGCIMGGGQPVANLAKFKEADLFEKRASVLYDVDKQATVRKSHENPDIIALYEEFLQKPNSEIAHKYLHTDK